MNIYRVHPDRLRYRLFTISTDEVSKKLGENTPFHIDPTPKPYAAIWQPLIIEFYDSTKNEAAHRLPDLTVESGRMYVNRKAYDLLFPLLKDCGEFLPVKSEAGSGYLFNVLALAEAVDGVDRRLSTRDAYGDLQSLAFHAERLRAMPVFRSGFEGYMGIFCSAEFKERVEQWGLRGIAFSSDLAGIFPFDPSGASPITQ